MKYTSSRRLILASAMAMASVAFAQDTVNLKVSTGSATGTYNIMFTQFQARCKDKVMMIPATSTGSIQNIDRLLGNEVNAVITQTDVLFARSRTEDLSNIKTLFSLHPEEVHVITTKTSLIKAGGFGGFGSKPIQLSGIEDLAGLPVAAWGGSVTTANVIRLQSEIAFNVSETNSFKEAKVALDSGQVAAIIMVGGQPMDDVKVLGTEYKMLSFSEGTVAKLKQVYSPARVTYSGMGSGANGVATVSTDALFVTRTYKSPKIVASMAALRQCFKDNLDDISETTGMHKKWASVKAENTGKWAYWELPTTSKK